MTKKKPEWDKPKLIVLVKASRAEVVLAVCKSNLNTGSTSPDAEYNDCAQDISGCADCMDYWAS